MTIRNVTLEMSLKPFFQMDDAFIESVCTKVFHQWAALIRPAQMVSVLLWTADGSEILDYRGNMEDEIEWARYIGGANPPPKPVGHDPQSLGLHSRWYYYRDNPPVIRYADLQRIVAAIKKVGSVITGKPIRVGATFDPGPEFAQSSFKYQRHVECILSATMGRDQHGFVGCIATLHADTVPYAGFPQGITEGTTIGTFLGRQSNCFMHDIGFDYIWLSNGFGFGIETWKVSGALFDGHRFNRDRVQEIRQRVLGFWHDFRRECPDALIETRGTNLPTSIDLSTDAVPLLDIYQGEFNMVAPPNSPWAAMDGDFGLEFAGYMSHIAMLPLDHSHFPFRYYVHDPWWLNSPWLDRYARQPHDIYLPLSISRITENGDIQTASEIEFLTIDNSYGQTPDQCPNEVIPHILQAVTQAPDTPGPLVWVYPLREYQQIVFDQVGSMEEVFYGDWFVREMINQGLPLNTVLLSDYLIQQIDTPTPSYQNAILISILPKHATPLADAMVNWIQRGGNVLFYGPTADADPRIMSLLCLQADQPIHGDLDITLPQYGDHLIQGSFPSQLRHNPLLSGGSITAALHPHHANPDIKTWAKVNQGTNQRIYALTTSSPQGGRIGWLRGTNGSNANPDMHLLHADDPAAYFNTGQLARWMLQDWGYSFKKQRCHASSRSGMLTLSRHNNAFYFSGYQPDMRVEECFRMPWGAPLFVDTETELRQGMTCYRFGRSWRHECRIFVDQHDAPLQCLEQCSVQMGVKRRLKVLGLSNATLRFYPEPGTQDNVKVLNPGQYPFVAGPFLDITWHDDQWGQYGQLNNLTGDVLISW